MYFVGLYFVLGVYGEFQSDSLSPQWYQFCHTASSCHQNGIADKLDPVEFVDRLAGLMEPYEDSTLFEDKEQSVTNGYVHCI